MTEVEIAFSKFDNDKNLSQYQQLRCDCNIITTNISLDAQPQINFIGHTYINLKN
jgi:hypothetical protein